MENYPKAAVRHWQDAELLAREARVDNADHHYGFAAACALKTAMVGLPAFTTTDGLDGDYHKHVDQLWCKVRHQSLQKAFPTLYAVLEMPNPFMSWSVDQRYSDTGVVSSSDMASHKDAAKRLLGSVRLLGVRST